MYTHTFQIFFNQFSPTIHPLVGNDLEPPVVVERHALESPVVVERHASIPL